MNDLSVVVSRVLGTVVVTVEGSLGVAGCEVLEAVLSDLLEGQGNLAVTLDLGRATVEPEALRVLETATRRALRRDATLRLRQPVPDTGPALQSGELADFAENLHRPVSG